MTIGDIRRIFGPLYFSLVNTTALARAVVCQFARGGIIMGQAFPPGSRLTLLAVALTAVVMSGCRAADAGTSIAPADVERLKTLVPSQSHTMQDVAYHWTNLWFAGQQGNWPLARFYFDEAHQHIQWTIQIRPIRKDPDGRDVDLQSIFQAVDSTLFAAVKIAIEQKNGPQFATAYKNSLDGCYSCHKSSGKPYLHPVVPTVPAQTIIDFSPETPAGQ
jgi:hypothetical protein